MKVLLLLIPFVIFYAGFVTGQVAKKRAVTKTYTEVQPVLRALRRLLNTNPITAPADYLLAETEAGEALSLYEQEARAF